MKMLGSKRPAEIPSLAHSDSDDSDEEEVTGASTAAKKARICLKTTAVHEEFTRFSAQLPGGKTEEISQCNHCNTNYSGKNPTTLRKHLKSKHPKLAAEVAKKDDEERFERLEAMNDSTSKSSSNRLSASEALFGARGRSSNKDSPNQNKIDKFISVSRQKRSKSLPPRPREKEHESERMLGFWVGGSTLPINFIEDPNFELFLQSYDIQVGYLYYRVSSDLNANKSFSNFYSNLPHSLDNFRFPSERGNLFFYLSGKGSRTSQAQKAGQQDGGRGQEQDHRCPREGQAGQHHN